MKRHFVYILRIEKKIIFFRIITQTMSSVKIFLCCQRETKVPISYKGNAPLCKKCQEGGFSRYLNKFMRIAMDAQDSDYQVCTACRVESLSNYALLCPICRARTKYVKNLSNVDNKDAKSMRLVRSMVRTGFRRTTCEKCACRCLVVSSYRGKKTLCVHCLASTR